MHGLRVSSFLDRLGFLDLKSNLSLSVSFRKRITTEFPARAIKAWSEQERTIHKVVRVKPG